MKKLCCLFSVFVFSSLIFCFPCFSLAAEPSYSVKPIFPKEQRDKEIQYFDIRVQPGESKVIEIEVKNTAEEPVKLDVSANTAITNKNGVLDYVPMSDDIVFSKTLIHPFSAFAQVQKEITVPAKSTQNIPVTMTLPVEPFNGIILGGIRFVDKDEEQAEDADESQGMSVRNKFAYIIPVRLSENDNPVPPKIELLDVRADQLLRKNAFIVELENPEPLLMREVEVDAEISVKGSKDVLYKVHNSDIVLAPNTLYQCPIYLGDKPFKAGNYTANVIVKKGEDEWKFTKDFEIKEEKAKEFNANSVEVVNQGINWWLYGGLLVAVGVIAILFVIWHSRNKAKKAIRKSGRKKKSGLSSSGGKSSKKKSSGSSMNGKKKEN